jgi:threonine dehydrogenase-like Zn-dependent dehydrogenase
MRAVRFEGSRVAAVVTASDPTPGAGEVVIEMRAAGLCGSDLEWYRGTGGLPVIPGHEPCGVVVALGAGVSGWDIGRRVVVNHHFGCGLCRHCRDGSPKYCAADHGTLGFTHDGADAQFMVARANSLVELPETLDFEQGAAIACGVGTAYTALRRLGVSSGDTLAIFGQGPVGMSATMLARALGADVIAIELVEERRRLAEASGAAHVINPSVQDPQDAVASLTGGRGVDAALDCSGSPLARVAAVRVVTIRGPVCFVGVGPPTELDITEDIIGKELTCHGSWTFTSSGLRACMDFVATSACPISILISHRSTIEQAPEVFALFEAGNTGKCLLVF